MEKKILDKIEEFNRQKYEYKKKFLFYGWPAFFIMLTYFIVMAYVFIEYEEELAVYVYPLFYIFFIGLIIFMAISDDKNLSKNKMLEEKIIKKNNQLLNKTFSEKELLKICDEEVTKIKEIINDKISNYEYTISVVQRKKSIKINIYIGNFNIYHLIDEKLKKTLGVIKKDLNEKVVDNLIKKEFINSTKKSEKKLSEILEKVSIKYNFPYGKYKGNETSKFYRDLYGVIKKYKNSKNIIEKIDEKAIYIFSTEQFSNYEFIDDIEKDIFININFNIIKEETKNWIQSINSYNEEIINRKQLINSRNTHEYENHCWNCHAHIDSKVNSRCFQCGWYICDECGACSVKNHQH